MNDGFKPGVNTVPCDYVITGDKTLFVGFYGSAKGTEYTVDVYETDGTPDGYIIANKNFYNYGNVFRQGGETLAAPIFCYATGGKGGLKDYDVQLIDSDGIRSEGSADDVVPTNHPRYRPLKLGVTWDRDTLRDRIDERLERRLNAGMIEEVQRLLDAGASVESSRIAYMSLRAARQPGRLL